MLEFELHSLAIKEDGSGFPLLVYLAPLGVDRVKPPGPVMALKIQYTAPGSVIDAISSLGRTEDLCFSPSGRRLAVAGFLRNRLTVFDVDIASSSGATQVALTGGVVLSSTALQLPHGIAFVDENTLIVTSRGGGVAFFRLPPGEEIVQTHEVLPIATWPADGTTLLCSPSSVAVTYWEGDVCEVLVCNNDGDTVTRHRINRDTARGTGNGEVLLHRYLNVPDGVTVSRDRQWIGVSNHANHNVMLYENSPALGSDTKPDGILRGVDYPHGLRFSADGRYLFVADGGAPYLHIYERDADQWSGVRHPLVTVRIMDEAIFEKGRVNLEEGGPKGVDIAASSNVLALTSACQPLAFFDVPALLQHASASGSTPEQRVWGINHELRIMEESRRRLIEVRALHDTMNALRDGISWRITGPLRRLKSFFRRFSTQGGAERDSWPKSE
jgi:sugar lactone lactonase YvrE